jgi:D-serine deaminase-like pyridoxal phosphate-dependent protein
LTAISQSEEHLVLKTTGKKYEVGDVLYGIPYHICPTVALYDRMVMVEDRIAAGDWIVERGR